MDLAKIISTMAHECLELTEIFHSSCKNNFYLLHHRTINFISVKIHNFNYPQFSYLPDPNK